MFDEATPILLCVYVCARACVCACVCSQTVMGKSPAQENKAKLAKVSECVCVFV